MTEQSTARRGVWIGVDVGSVRVGVARSDPDGVLASPLCTLRRAAGDGADVDELAGIVAAERAVLVVVGHPRHLSGARGTSALDAESYAAALRTRVSVPVELVDERLSTVVAQQSLRRSGVRGKAQRAVIDQAAAVAILQSALDAARGTMAP